MYFRIAKFYQIVDLPNHRTMHDGSTIRGGGIVIFIAIAIFSLFIQPPGYYFFSGIILIGLTGFLDDLIDLSGRIRIPLQALSVFLILADLNLFDLNFALLIMVIILATGTLNAFNFMDGINGMTGGYGLVTLGSLQFVNIYVYSFASNDFLYLAILALLVFNFFNFRNKAVCFAGDVGSLTIAFIIVYLIIKLISETHELSYILFLTLYGIDTIFTIIQRIFLKQNIFEAHRLHLFQVLVSNTGISHLRMSGIYMTLQVIINFIVILVIPMAFNQQIVYLGIMLMVLSLVYVLLKRKMMSEAL